MVFGLFSKEKALKRAMDKTVNKHAQSADRWAAMEKLRNDGSEEALFALCRRLSFNYDKTIEDEQEKQWVYETLTSKGPDAVAPLLRYMKQADSIAYPLRIRDTVPAVARCPYYEGFSWADPDPEHLRQLLREVYEDRNGARRRGAAAAREMAEKWTWDRAAGKIVERLEAIG